MNECVKCKAWDMAAKQNGRDYGMCEDCYTKHHAIFKDIMPIFEESSGNVFADLGLPNADELQERSRLAVTIYGLARQKRLDMRYMLFKLPKKLLEEILECVKEIKE